MYASRRVAAAVVLFSLTATLSAADKPLPRVPEGFTIEVAAGPDLTQHPIMAGFDDRGRLFLAETAGLNLPAAELKEKLPNFIRMLEDTNGDGKFDKSTIFADKLTFPQGALWHRGALYVASSGAIWKFVDTDDDGKADERTELVNKFGFTGNAADVHGPFLGPEGRIYWCEGRHGHEIRDRKGNLISQGKAARIFSCEPDGSDIQVFCGGGMDNPVEIDFLETGEMIGDVNIMLNPRGDCLVHWVRGGVYPRDDQQPVLAEFQRTGDLLPPIHDYGHVAVSGLTRYRSKEFGDDYQNDFFVTQFNTHKVVRTKLERSGSTFKVASSTDFFVSDDPDCHPTDVFEDADGSLLVIDTGGWFRIGCPVSQVAKPEIAGAIYRIRKTGAHKVEDPRGLKIDFATDDPYAIIRLLGDGRPVVQAKATERLSQMKADDLLGMMIGSHEVPGVGVVLSGPADEIRKIEKILTIARRPDVRCRVVWTLARSHPRNDPRPAAASSASGKELPLSLGTPGSDFLISYALKDLDESVRISAIRSLQISVPGELNSLVWVGRLGEMMEKDSPSIRREAAGALGRNYSSVSNRNISREARSSLLSKLFGGLRVSSVDRVLEHALIYALIEIADGELTLPYLKDSNPIVRRAALIALDQMKGGDLKREEVTALLDTDDPVLQTAALDVISRRKGWAAQTTALLKSWLAEPTLTSDRATVLRGFLLAQAADPSLQALVAETLARPELPESHRLLLMEVIQRASFETLPKPWVVAVARMLADGSPELRLQAVRIVQERRLEGFDEGLRKLLTDDGHAPELQVEALLALAPRIQVVEAREIDFLFGRLKEDVPPLSRLSAARALAELPLTEPQLLDLAKRFDAAGPLAVPVLLRAFSHTPTETTGLALVKGLEASKSAASLSPDEVAAMLRTFPAPVQAAAANLLKKLGIDPEQQRLRLEDLEARTNEGDAKRGHDLFFGKKAACAGCHTVAGKGGKVGPDLTTIGAIRTNRDLLEAVVYPSASFARGFRTYIVVTTDGKVHTGVISRESADTVYLRTAELAELRIPRDKIEEMRESPVSIMPKGLETTLTPEELRDLMAWLRGRKPAQVPAGR